MYGSAPVGCMLSETGCAALALYCFPAAFAPGVPALSVLSFGRTAMPSSGAFAVAHSSPVAVPSDHAPSASSALTSLIACKGATSARAAAAAPSPRADESNDAATDAFQAPSCAANGVLSPWCCRRSAGHASPDGAARVCTSTLSSAEPWPVRPELGWSVLTRRGTREPTECRRERPAVRALDCGVFACSGCTDIQRKHSNSSFSLGWSACPDNKVMNLIH
jgi:hypothetical protein